MIRAGERGSASVEFALVLPLVLIMALALVQVGLVVKDRLILEEVARAGARQGAVSTDDASVIETAIGAAVSLRADELEVSIARESGEGSAVTVTVVYHDAVTVPIVGWLFPSSIDLSAKVAMRQETS